MTGHPQHTTWNKDAIFKHQIIFVRITIKQDLNQQFHANHPKCYADFSKLLDIYFNKLYILLEYAMVKFLVQFLSCFFSLIYSFVHAQFAATEQPLLEGKLSQGKKVLHFSLVFQTFDGSN